MKSLALKTLTSDNSVVILALLLTAVLFTTGAGKTQQLQRGISVELATTTSAGSVPGADNADAWIVTVRRDGAVYFGLENVSEEGILQAMQSRPRKRDQRLYIKADARSPFATVQKALDAARADFFESAILLTEQHDSPAPGTVVPPKGLPIWFGSAAAPEAVVVQIGPGQGSPTLKIDNQEIPLKALQHKLEQLLQNHKDRVVVLKPGQVPFADVAHVVDVCNLTGAKAVVGAPDL